jgi:hypothetical protein
MNATFDAGPLGRLLARVANRTLIQRLPVSLCGRKQPILRSVAPKVNAQSLEQNRRKRNITRYSALRLTYVDQHSLAVDVLDLKVL